MSFGANFGRVCAFDAETDGVGPTMCERRHARSANAARPTAAKVATTSAGLSSALFLRIVFVDGGGVKADRDEAFTAGIVAAMLMSSPVRLDAGIGGSAAGAVAPVDASSASTA